MGTLLSLLIVILILAVVFWLIGQLPLDPQLLQIIKVVVILIALVYFLSLLWPLPLRFRG